MPTQPRFPPLVFVLRHAQLIPILLLVALALVCWLWVVVLARDMYGPMTGPSAWMMTARWDGRHVFLWWAMWTAMMTAMMLPSAVPALVLLGGGGPRAGASRITCAAAAGYLAVWSLFSLAATALQRVLAGAAIVSPMLEVTAPAPAALLLALAGAYQLTPLKRACLARCQSPTAFLVRRWRAGVAGAFRMGLEHGTYCVGCCWALMLLLFVGGVMNLAVVIALALLVAVEKLSPPGGTAARVSGILLLAMAAWIWFR